MTTMPEVWRDEMYLGAKKLWPDLTPRQFREAALTWLSDQQGNVTIQQIAVGLELELIARYGTPNSR